MALCKLQSDMMFAAFEGYAVLCESVAATGGTCIIISLQDALSHVSQHEMGMENFSRAAHFANDEPQHITKQDVSRFNHRHQNDLAVDFLSNLSITNEIPHPKHPSP